MKRLFILFLLFNFCSSTNNIVLQEHEKAWCINWSDTGSWKVLNDIKGYSAVQALYNSFRSARQAIDETKYEKEEVETLSYNYFNSSLKGNTTPYVNNLCKVWYDLEQGRSFLEDN